MGLIRKSLRAASFVVAPIPTAAGLGPKGESKKQRYLRQIAEGQAEGGISPQRQQTLWEAFQAERRSAAQRPATSVASASIEPSSPTEDAVSVELQRLAQMHGKGELTDEEFAAAKRKVLDL
jgi:hypothetical protein